MPASSNIRCGVARVDISPAIGTPLAGYPFVERPCRGTHDPLYATAVVFEARGAMAAVVALDVLAVGPALVGAVREQARRRLGIPPDHLMVCATHTHSAPALPLGPAADAAIYGVADPAYAARIPSAMDAALRAAVTALRPSALTLARAPVDGVASNRRRPGGVTDPQLTALVARDPAGVGVGALVTFACHPTVLHADNCFASSDFPCTARRVVEERCGGVALYATGAAGDQSTRYTRRESSFDEAARLGTIVGEAAAGAAGHSAVVAGHGVSGRRRRITLPFRRLPVLHDAERALARAEKQFADMRASGAAAAALRSAEVAVFGARHTARWVKSGAGRSGDAEAEIQILSIGGLKIVGLPVELFAEDGLRLHAETTAPMILICYANDMLGYAPPAAAFNEGGYEPSSTLLGPEARDHLMDATRDLLEAVP